MNFKFSVKQLILMTVIACAITIPRYPRYLSLDTHSQLRVSLIYTICLVVAWAAVVRLAYDYLKNERENIEYDNKSLHNNKNEAPENNFDNCYENVSIDNKIALMQRLRELKPWKFEEFVKMLFKFRSYKIEKEPSYYIDTPQADWWKDLIVQKNNKIESVQIKKYYLEPISKNTIATFKWLIWDEPWYFITTSVFYDDAKSFAEENWIRCIDYDKLYCVISKLPEKDKKTLEEFINNPKNIGITAHPKTCKKCWAPMKRRKWGYGCLRYNINCCGKEQCKCREFYK